jgi:uncharacterized cupredoxin-like copper-binding protein
MGALLMSACGSPAAPAPSTPAQAVEQAAAAPPAQATAEPVIPVVDLGAHDLTFDMPMQVPAGLVTINFMNHGKEYHHAVIVKMTKPDTSMEKIVEALSKDEDPDFVDFSKGAYLGVIDPNRSIQLTTAFEPGTYLMLCFIEGPNGMPHAAQGMMRKFDVVENAGAAQPAEPKADLVVTVKKDGVDFQREIKTGQQTWKIVNETGEPFNGGVDVARLSDGKTREDLEKFIMGDGGSPLPANAPGNAIGGGGSPSGPVWITLDLQAGDNYWLQTNVPDPQAPTPASQDQEPRTIWIPFQVK